MSMRIGVLPTICLCAVAALLAAAAGAAVSHPDPLPAATLAKKEKKKPKPRPLAKSPDLWATINVCDTKDNPNTIGIRGSMPGLGGRKKTRLQIRFQVQYQEPGGAWKDTDETADSGWRTVGRTRSAVLETGQNFKFQPPESAPYTLRGTVRFRWQLEGRTLKELGELTQTGHRSTDGADPQGYTAATCQISAP
jgi:hypothetical protein